MCKVQKQTLPERLHNDTHDMVPQCEIQTIPDVGEFGKCRSACTGGMTSNFSMSPQEENE